MMEGDERTFRVNFSSEGVARLRKGVKEKLKEFMGDYTDDTLVEYVIVLLKNGRRKDEARNELNVFLGDDSDCFISWLWDHLGSNISLYVVNQEVHRDEAPKVKSTAGDQSERSELHQIESEPDKGSSGKKSGYHNNQDRNGSVGDVDESELPVPQKSPDDNVNAQDEPHRRGGRVKPSLSPRSSIQKKRRRTEEQQPRRREASQPAVSAPRRLLQFAVRDAVATSRLPNSTAEPSVKRLKSVVSTPMDPSLEKRPQRIRSALGSRISMSAAIKAVAEAAKDVSQVRHSRNVFDRIGRATDVSHAANLQEEYGGVAEEDVGGGDFGADMQNLDSHYQPQNDSRRQQERNDPSFHGTLMASNLGYDGEGYDDDESGRESTYISQRGVSHGNLVENSLNFQYGAADNTDERLHRRKDLSQPLIVPNTSLKVASAVSMNTHVPPQYQEDREFSQMDNHKVMRGSDTAVTEFGIQLNQENNPTIAFNGNAKPDTIPQQSQKTQLPTGLHNAGPPTENADSRTIFVSNVHFAATKDTLSRHFNKFGEVLKVIILTDPATGQPKGSAYVEFMRKEAAEHAISLDGTSFMSRILKIARKSSVQPDTASVKTWPRVAQPSLFAVPRFGRAPFVRGVPSLYRARMPVKPGARSFQWKRDAHSMTDTSGQASNSNLPPMTTRSLTYVRTEPKTNGNSTTV